jgi:hypothetical protein
MTGQIKLRNEELADIYSSSNIFRVIKLNGKLWAGYVECTGNEKYMRLFSTGTPTEQTNSEMNT